MIRHAMASVEDVPHRLAINQRRRATAAPADHRRGIWIVSAGEGPETVIRTQRQAHYAGSAAMSAKTRDDHPHDVNVTPR